MHKKIFGIFLAILLLLIPQTVFAESFANCVIAGEEMDIYIDLTESHELYLTMTNGINTKDYKFDLSEEDASQIIEYLKTGVKDEELTNDENSVDAFYNSNSYLGYLLIYLEGDSAGIAYSTSRPLYTEDELDKGILTTIIERELAEQEGLEESSPIPDTYNPETEDMTTTNEEDIQAIKDELSIILPELGTTLVTMLITSCLVPIFIFIFFIKILKALAKKSTKNTGYNYTTRNKTYKNMDEQFFDDLVDEYNRSSQNKSDRKKTMNNQTSKRKSDPWSIDRNDDDPFSL